MGRKLGSFVGFHWAFSTITDFTQSFSSFPTSTLILAHDSWALSPLPHRSTYNQALGLVFPNRSPVTMEDERPFWAIIRALWLSALIQNQNFSLGNFYVVIWRIQLISCSFIIIVIVVKVISIAHLFSQCLFFYCTNWSSGGLVGVEGCLLFPGLKGQWGGMGTRTRKGSCLEWGSWQELCSFWQRHTVTNYSTTGRKLGEKVPKLILSHPLLSYLPLAKPDKKPEDKGAH